MAEKENNIPDDGDDPKGPKGNELVIPADGGSLRPAMVHRTDHSPLTKAE